MYVSAILNITINCVINIHQVIHYNKEIISQYSGPAGSSIGILQLLLNTVRELLWLTDQMV